MIKIKTFQCNMLQENSYVVYDETREAVIIDCGAYYDSERAAVVQFLRDEELQLKHVLCTHGHLDHCFGNDTLYDELGLKPEIHQLDEFLAKDLAQQAADIFGMAYDRPTPPIGHYLSDGEQIVFGNHHLTVIHTPGHSPGCVTFYCHQEYIAFTGDTLFRMSVGRTDFERGSWSDMVLSLRRLSATLPPQTTLYPGHGPKTTMQEEIAMNPYLRN